MITVEQLEKKLSEADKVGLKCINEAAYIDQGSRKSGWMGKMFAETVLSFDPLVITLFDGTHAHIENRIVGIQKDDLCFFAFDNSVPIYSDGFVAEVGHTIIKDNTPKEIIRVDSRTRQVWYKKGGFDWFEDMKNYMEA